MGIKKIINGVWRTYAILSIIVFTLLLVSFGYVTFELLTAKYPEKRVVPIGGKMTHGEGNDEIEVVVIGTIHRWHQENKNYSADKLLKIIKGVNPELILVEMPRRKRWIVGFALCRKWPGIAKEYSRNWDGWAALKAGHDLDVPVVPFDWSGRDDFYQETNYPKRQIVASGAGRKWANLEVEKYGDKASPVARLYCALFKNGGNGLKTIRYGSARYLNSVSFDNNERTRHLFLYELLPTEMGKDAKWSEAAKELEWVGQHWEQRTDEMLKNIKEYIEKYEVKRVVVITGGTHRYNLIPAIDAMEGVEVKEYWELIGDEKE